MWGRTDVGQGKYINRTRRMQGRTDKGHKGYRMQILKDTRTNLLLLMYVEKNADIIYICSNNQQIKR